MHENSFIAAKLRISANADAIVQGRLHAVEQTLTPKPGTGTTAHVTPAERIAFWTELGTWCAQNLAACEGASTAATTGGGGNVTGG
jgi:hypothetical protein